MTACLVLNDKSCMQTTEWPFADENGTVQRTWKTVADRNGFYKHAQETILSILIQSSFYILNSTGTGDDINEFSGDGSLTSSAN